MAPKRKSDAIETAPGTSRRRVSDPYIIVLSDGEDKHVADKENAPPAKKKARVSDSGDAAPSKAADKPEKWQDVVIPGNEDGNGPIYDTPGEIRRKIRLLLKEPGFKITHWLRDIGDINSNSYRRFMACKGPMEGCENGTYFAGYLHFEKRRILEGKKKTATRLKNEKAGGLRLVDPRRPVWVTVGPGEDPSEIAAMCM